MRPWMLACDWSIASDCRRLVAWVQLDWTRQILAPSSRILLATNRRRQTPEYEPVRYSYASKFCAADCRRIVGVRSVNRALGTFKCYVTQRLGGRMPDSRSRESRSRIPIHYDGAIGTTTKHVFTLQRHMATPLAFFATQLIPGATVV